MELALGLAEWMPGIWQMIFRAWRIKIWIWGDGFGVFQMDDSALTGQNLPFGTPDDENGFAQGAGDGMQEVPPATEEEGTLAPMESESGIPIGDTGMDPFEEEPLSAGRYGRGRRTSSYGRYGERKPGSAVWKCGRYDRRMEMERVAMLSVKKMLRSHGSGTVWRECWNWGLAG